jgi:hypothetical protein
MAIRTTPGNPQVAIYDDGVGNANLRRRLKILAGATGWGLSRAT